MKKSFFIHKKFQIPREVDFHKKNRFLALTIINIEKQYNIALTFGLGRSVLTCLVYWLSRDSAYEPPIPSRLRRPVSYLVLDQMFFSTMDLFCRW
jgi:hypothetical protein